MNLDPPTTRIAPPDLLIPRVQRPGTGPGIPLVPDHLELGLAVLGPLGPRPVTEQDLAAWGLTVHEALARADANLRERSGPEDWQRVLTVPGMLSFGADDGCAASRMTLLTELIEPWPFEGVLVAVPTADQLLAVPLTDVDSLDALRVLMLAGQAAQKLGNHPLSDQVFWFDGETIKAIEVTHTPDQVEVNPPPEFIAALERLTVLGWVPVAAEA